MAHVRRYLLHRLTQILIGVDVVALEHRLAPVARDRHGDLPVDPCPAQVPDTGAPEVVEDPARLAGLDASLTAGGRPGLAELVDANRHARVQVLRRRPLMLPPEDQPAVEPAGREPALHDGAQRSLEGQPPRSADGRMIVTPLAR